MNRLNVSSEMCVLDTIEKDAMEVNSPVCLPRLAPIGEEAPSFF